MENLILLTNFSQTAFKVCVTSVRCYVEKSMLITLLVTGLYFIQIMNTILISTKSFTFLLFGALFKQDLSDLAYDEFC